MSQNPNPKVLPSLDINTETRSFLVEVEVDALGLKCPEPVMMIHQALRKIKSGLVIFVQANDPSTLRDIPKLCMFLNHELLAQIQTESMEYHFWIRKG